MDFATFLKIQNLQNDVLGSVHPQATHLIENYDVMDSQEFLSTLLSFAMDISALASTLTAEAIVGTEAFVQLSEELDELKQIEKIVMDTQ